MSSVTSVTLVVSYTDLPDETFTAHNFAPGGRCPQSLVKVDDEYLGGSKYIEVDLYAAGFNHVDPEDVREWFQSLPWGDLDAAFLVWETNGELRGHISRGWVNW